MNRRFIRQIKCFVDLLKAGRIKQKLIDKIFPQNFFFFQIFSKIFPLFLSFADFRGWLCALASAAEVHGPEVGVDVGGQGGGQCGQRLPH